MRGRFEPISLGWDCSQKFQICRALLARAHPGAPIDRLREALADGRASKIFRRLPFDAQITPIQALIEYLERDFQGVFDREDLTVSERGFVIHRRLLTQHPHEFHAVDGRLDEAVLDAQYPAARAKFERRAASFRALWQEEGPFLYVRSETPWPEQVERLIKALSSRNPRHRFHLLLTRETLRDDLDAFSDHVTQAVVTPVTSKSDAHTWEGNDQDWDRAFADFELALSGGRAFTANLNPIRPIDDGSVQAVNLKWGLPPAPALMLELPHTFSIPDMAWAFAVMSCQVDPLASAAAKTLLLKVEALAGHVGVGLVRADGKAMIGREYGVSPEDGVLTVSLPLVPQMEAARVVFRNYGVGGAAGALRLHGVALADA